jgi:hypothetical protein
MGDGHGLPHVGQWSAIATPLQLGLRTHGLNHLPIGTEASKISGDCPKVDFVLCGESVVPNAMSFSVVESA